MRKKASFKKLLELSEMSGKSGADPEILEKGRVLCQPPWLANEENFRFQMA